jgi:hemerythrin
MFLLSILILALLVMIVLGFMLGFNHPLPWILIIVLAIIPVIHDRIVARRFIKWTDKLSVGIDIIDTDHKKLLGMINQLQTAAHYQTDESLIESTLNDLIDYTKYHFSREEKLMLKNNYPDFETHKKQHDAMIKQVTKFINEYRIDKTRTIDNVILYLKTWLINHIHGSDQEYAPFIKDSNID